MPTLIENKTNVRWFILSPFVLFSFFTLAPVLEISSVDFIPYNSTHMRLILNPFPVVLMVKRDAKNNMISMDGVAAEMLKWLSVFDHFTYGDTKILTTSMENKTNAVGSIYYMDQGYADLMVVPLRMTPERLDHLFFPHHWLEETSVLVIPAPTTEANISSVSQPFESIIWVWLFVSLVAIITVLYVLTTPKVTSLFGRPIDDSLESDRLGAICFFVFGLLFSQGGSLPSERLVIRLATLTWGLAAFVIVQAYCSILTSFLTTPSIVNLVNSPEELAAKSDVRLIVRSGYDPDFVISSSQDSFYKKLAEKLNAYPDSRCAVVGECMDKVLLGGTVFINAYGGVLEAMKNDFQKTGRCRFSIARKSLFSRTSALGLAKNSTRKESFNRGILQMREKGLLDMWKTKFQPMPRRCLDEIENKPTGEPTKLTLAGLSGAFLILGVGLLAATISFISEITTGYYSYRRRCKLASRKVNLAQN